MMDYYTYLHLKADTGEIFYVGKGMASRKRAESHFNRTKYWRNVVAKHGLVVKIAAYWEHELDAFAHECLLISSLRGMGVCLVNLTDGGDGLRGYRHSEEFRKWQADRVHTLFKDSSYSERHGQAQKARFADPAARTAHGEKIRSAWTQEKRALAAITQRQRFATQGHPRRKATEEVIDQMVRLRQSGVMLKDVAKQFGMSRTRAGTVIRKANLRVKSKAPEVRDMAEVAR